MASFIGSYEEFIKFIGPRTRNVVNSITRNHKREISKCEHCHKDNIELEAAHVHGRERPVIIKEITSLFEHNGVITIDLEKFESLFKNAHYPIANSVLVLCSECHRIYDAQTETIETIETIQVTEPVSHINIVDELPNNAEITEYFRENTPLFDEQTIINLLSLDYCHLTFGLNFAVLKEIPFNATIDEIRALSQVNGRNRWSTQHPPEKAGRKFLITTQWFERNRQPFVNWRSHQ